MRMFFALLTMMKQHESVLLVIDLFPYVHYVLLVVPCYRKERLFKSLCLLVCVSMEDPLPPTPLPPYETVRALSDLYAFQCSQ